MYIPRHFAETCPERLHAAMAAYPLATLVTLSPRGVEANPVPLLLRAGQNELHGHVARANPLWREHLQGADALAVFSGPQAYVSPGWYPTKLDHGKAVPTWNYITVQARGRLRVIDDTEWKRHFLDALTAVHEAGEPAPWRTADAPAEYIDNMIKAVVGIVIEITELTGKWKVSQNQPEQNRAAVGAMLLARGNALAPHIG